MTLDFFSEPSDIIEYIRQKRPEIHFDYDEIMHYAHHRTFTVAKITQLDLLSDIQESLAYAQKKGLGFEEWKESIMPTLVKKGWLGNIKVKNPKTGEEKEIYVGSRRLKNIYNTNMRVARAVSNYKDAMNSDAKYLRYVAVLDGRTRASHRALHGLILPKDHKFWDTHYPPNAWNCRCTARAYTKEELESRGWQVSTNIPNIDPDPDWKYNVGKSDHLDDVFADKVKNLKNKEVSKEFYENAKAFLDELEHKRNLYIWQRSLDEAIDELLIKKNLKSPIEVFQIGVLSEFIAKEAKEILKFDVENNFIMGNKSGILHIRAERKGKYGQDLSADELKRIVDVLDNGKTPVSVDKTNRNIIFWFEDLNDKKKINKIVVDLNYRLKKFGATNYMVTVGKVNKTNMKEKEFVRIR
ncbi:MULTISPECIES: phage head morphogenesis protein [Campylobacter]|uniref:phage head morphogenesis protein n=1 Tax=Campylobacter TaxID=194 RepID=UPI00027A3649|nr:MULTISPECIES: phage minor head protein [Campylobacter]EJP76221.1 phage protein F-like protein [Campylobacter sp. FOBRC14]